MGAANIPWFEVSAIAGWCLATLLALRFLTYRIKRRAMELETAANALSVHYAALDAVVDDPALPTDALRFLVRLNHVISDHEACVEVTDHMADLAAGNGAGDRPKWAAEVDQLARTRPELVEAYRDATMAGMVALFNRWPGTSWKMQLVWASLDRKRQDALADRIVQHSTSHGSFPSNAIIA